MKKSLTVSVLTGLAMLTLSSGVASAWYYKISGNGICQPDGSYKITWKVDNTSEPTALEIKSSNNPAVVPVGTNVPAGSFTQFTQIADGTKPGNFTLTLRGDWQGDRSNQLQSATVSLKQACEQPTTPTPTPQPQGGQGGAVLGQQVTVTPAGAVNAGEGKSAPVTALAGVVVSSFVLAYGIVSSLKARV